MDCESCKSDLDFPKKIPKCAQQQIFAQQKISNTISEKTGQPGPQQNSEVAQSLSSFSSSPFFQFPFLESNWRLLTPFKDLRRVLPLSYTEMCLWVSQISSLGAELQMKVLVQVIQREGSQEEPVRKQWEQDEARAKVGQRCAFRNLHLSWSTQGTQESEWQHVVGPVCWTGSRHSQSPTRLVKGIWVGIYSICQNRYVWSLYKHRPSCKTILLNI